MPIKFSFYFFLILVSNVVFGQTWSNYSAENSGLPSNKILSITIVENIIWVNTDNGISSFDGTDWKTYSTEDGISKINNHSVLQKDTSNILWLAGNNGATSFSVENLFISSEINYISKSNSNILSDTIKTIGIDFNLYKWLGSEKGVSIISAGEVLNLQSGITGIKLNNNQINSFSISHDTVSHRNKKYIPDGGLMYVATNGGGVSRFYNHEVDGISSASIVQRSWSGLPSDTVLTVFIDEQNNHWYGTPKGVASHLEHDSKNANWYNYTIEDGLIDNKVTSIASEDNGRMWFGTVNGLSSFDGEIWESYSESDGLIGNNISDVEVDSNINIWIATNKGLSKLSDIPVGIDNYSKNIDDKIVSFNAYPNPFNLSISFSFSLLKSENANFQIFNSIGELVKEIKSTSYSKGLHTVNWNAQNENNEIVNSGIYLVRMQTQSMIVTKKIILLK